MKSFQHHSRKRATSKSETGNQQSELVKLAQAMQSVQTNTSEAKANETSMSDNNGKRIKYRGRKEQSRKKTTSHRVEATNLEPLLELFEALIF